MPPIGDGIRLTVKHGYLLLVSRWQRIGVAVGNASPEAKEAADYVCGDIDEGGILEACYHLGLIH